MTTAPNLVVAGHPGLSRKLRNTGRFPAVFDVASATELRKLAKSGMVPPPVAFMFAPGFNEDLPGAGVPRLADDFAASGFTVIVHGFFTERGDRFGPKVIAARKPLSLSDLLATLGATAQQDLEDLQPEPPPEPWTLPGTPPADPIKDGTGDEHQPPGAPPVGEPSAVADKKPGIPSTDKLLVGRPPGWQPANTASKGRQGTAVPEEQPVNAVPGQRSGGAASEEPPVNAVPDQQPGVPVPDGPPGAAPGQRSEGAPPEEPPVNAVPDQQPGGAVPDGRLVNAVLGQRSGGAAAEEPPVDVVSDRLPVSAASEEWPESPVPDEWPVNAVPGQQPGDVVVGPRPWVPGADEQLGGVGRGPGAAHVTSGRRRSVPMALAVFVLAVAAAIGAGGLVFGGGAPEQNPRAEPTQPAPSPAKSSQTPSPQAQPTKKVPTSTPTAVRPAKELVPGRVRIVDGSVSIEVTWEDRSGGQAVYYVVGGPKGRPPSTLATAPRGAEKVTVAALNPGVNYCLTVVAVVDVDRVGQSEPVCTRRVEQEE